MAACQASLSITNSRSLLKLMSIESVMLSNHLILCHPLLLLPSIFPGMRVFSNESTLRIRWPKYWSFSFNISPSNEHPGLISFRMDWLDLFAGQGTLKSLLQHHSSKALIHWHSAFFLYFFSFLKPGLLFFKNWTIWTLHTLTKLGLCLLYGLQTFPTLCLSPLKSLNIFHNKKQACSLSIFFLCPLNFVTCLEGILPWIIKWFHASSNVFKSSF